MGMGLRLLLLMLRLSLLMLQLFLPLNTLQLSRPYTTSLPPPTLALAPGLAAAHPANEETKPYAASRQP